MTRPSRDVVVLALLAFALRLVDVHEAPPALLEDGVSAAGRALSAAAVALAIVPLAAALERCAGRPAALAGALFLAVDPLSIEAGRQAGAGGPLALAAALGLFAALGGGARRARVLALVLAAAVAGVAAFLGARAGGGPEDANLLEPVFVPWQALAGPALGPLLTVVHLAGYALVPLAAAGALARRSGPALVVLAVAAAAAVAATLLHGPRVPWLAPLAPPLAALAALAVGRRVEVDVLERRRPFAAGLLVALVLAVNLPVLASDLRAPPRLPWDEALARLDAVEREAGSILTTLPAALGERLGRPVSRLEDARLLDVASLAPRIVVLPVVNGVLLGGDAALLDEVEKRRVATFEVRRRRFDLLRIEIRVYRFG